MKQLLIRPIALLILLAAGGCVVPAAVAYKLFGPPPNPARYTPPKEPILVLVENTHSTAATIPEADELATTVLDELKIHEVAPVVDLQRIHELRDVRPAEFRRMSISEIGRQVGARQVLYIDLKKVEVDAHPGGDMVSLHMKAAVKMIDVNSALTVWPGDEASEPFEFNSPKMRITTEMSAAMLKRQSLRLSGIEIAKMFYKHQVDTMTEENKDVRLR